MIRSAIPSPAQGVWHVGPFPVRMYALCILAGIAVATVLTRRRWVAGRAGRRRAGCGRLGGAVRHRRRPALPRDHRPRAVLHRRQAPVRALYIWDGGLGIWGAVALGARRGVDRLPPPRDQTAGLRRRPRPGLVIAQAMGRWGNYFNQELYGRPPSCPGRSTSTPPAARQTPRPSRIYHPTFLYESLWDLWASSRSCCGSTAATPTLRRGRLFACYVAWPTRLAAAWIEALRIDHANHILGLRLNDWISLVAARLRVPLARVGAGA